MTPIEVPFKRPTEQNGYRLFSEDLENNPNVLFHGTSEDCAASIIANGFKPTGTLRSSSFVRTSEVALKFACEKRTEARRGAVLAAAFDTLDVAGIRQEGDVVYLDDSQLQPIIMAVCFVPIDYHFR